MAARIAETSADVSALAKRSGWRSALRGLRVSWPILKYILGLAALAVAVWVLSSHTDELSGLSKVFDDLRWEWIPPALGVEFLSYVSFAGMQRALLKSGGLQAPSWTLLKTAFASQALTNALPGGSAASAVYGFRWFRRFGADSTLAAWSMVGSVIASIVSLSLVATAGLALATSQGSSLDLIPVLLGSLILTIAIGALFVYERPLVVSLSLGVRVSRALFRRPRGDGEAQVRRITQWIATVRLGWREIVSIVAWGTGNWLMDCACFTMMFLAIGAGIPWKGLLLAYGAGQLAATLPITPGGLGAVEGSITIALVAFGGAKVATVDAVLMYRLISFWLVLLVGGVLGGELAWEVRRGRWSRAALSAPSGAGVGITA